MLHAARRLCRHLPTRTPLMARAASPSAPASPPPPPPPAAPVVAEAQVYGRYLSVFQRDVKLPASHGRPEETVSYDVVGHPNTRFTFVVVFPFHSGPTPEVTMVREFCQGPNEWLLTLPAGGFDPARHASLAAAAAAELSEEARLTGGDWCSLLKQEAATAGAAEGKWSANRFHAYLCVDPHPDATPGPRDAEERIDVVRVPVADLGALVAAGRILPPSVSVAWAAVDELRRRGAI